MKTSIFLTTLLSIAAFNLSGCGSNTNSTNLQPLGTTSNPNASITIFAVQTDANDTHQAPTVVATANNFATFTTTTINTPVNFDANVSNTDANITSYTWTDMDGNVLSQDKNFTRTFYENGIYEKTLTVLDDKNATSFDRVCVLVGITQTDIPLIATAGLDVTTQADKNVTLTGRVICKDGNYTYNWSEDGTTLANSATFTKAYAEGTHNVLLKVTDENNNSAWDAVQINATPAQ